MAKVLIVEDEPAYVDALSVALEREGFVFADLLQGQKRASEEVAQSPPVEEGASGRT